MAGDDISKAVREELLNSTTTRVTREKKTVWTIVVDAGVDCPSCEQEMETVMRFHPVNGRVGSCTRRELQHKGFDYWLDHAKDTEDVCPGCGYVIRP